MNEELNIKEEVGADGTAAGVEVEVESIITNPFDPDKIHIGKDQLPIEKFFRRIRQGMLELAPSFQRNEVWTKKQKSQLIESLILNIPLPMFYVSEDENEKWFVVDGLQRFSTIRDFVLGTDENSYSKAQYPYNGDGFKLADLEFFDKYNGLYFKDLPEHIQNRILDSDFNITVIKNGTPEQVKFNIFKRINTGGMPLSSQEIRHALYQGTATKLLTDLSSCESFLNATNNSVNPSRMADRELILRMLSFIIRGIDSFRTNYSMENYLNETMNIINYNFVSPKPNLKEYDYFNNIQITNITDIKKIFDTAMKRAYILFGKCAFRRSILDDKKLTPINKAIFDSLGTFLGTIEIHIFDALLNKQKEFKKSLDVMVNKKLYVAFGSDSSKSTGVMARLELISVLIQYYSGSPISEESKTKYKEAFNEIQ